MQPQMSVMMDLQSPMVGWDVGDVDGEGVGEGVGSVVGDTDGSGDVSKREFRLAIKALGFVAGCGDREIDAVFDEAVLATGAALHLLAADGLPAA